MMTVHFMLNAAGHTGRTGQGAGTGFAFTNRILTFHFNPGSSANVV